MSTSDYRRGFDDGRSSARAEADALRGPDRTLYECIGGPKNGERIETGGSEEFFVALTTPSTAYSDPYWYAPPYGTDLSIKRGVYRRRDIASYGNRRTVYTYQGER